MAKKKIENIYWLVGDRYVCIERKKQIIETLQEQEKIDVENLTGLNVDQIYSSMTQEYLFGVQKTIYVHDGEIPDINKIVKFLSSFPKNKTLIVVEDTVDKRKIMYKKFKNNLEEYVSVVQKNGFPDKKLIPKSLKMIKIVSNWEGDEKVLEQIFKESQYNFGITLQEIAKIMIYRNGDPINDIKEVDGILCRNEIPDVSEVMDEIILGNHVEALKKTKNIFNLVDVDEFFMQFIGSLVESLTFIAHICLAQESGKQSKQEVSEFMTDTLIKDGKKGNPQTIKNRLYFYQDKAKWKKSENALKAVSEAESAVEEFIMKKGTTKYIINRFVARACNCFV